jgi:hypothetical protein
MLRNEASQYVGSNPDYSLRDALRTFRKAPLRMTNYTFQNFSNMLLARLYPFFGNANPDAETFVGQ